MPDASPSAPLHVVILCHPDDGSFNAAVATEYCAAVRAKGHRAIVRDLYAMGFHPVLKGAERPGAEFRQFREVTDELDILRGAAAFVLVYPIWFGTPPAMLKGYVERVLGSAVTPQDVEAGTAKGVLAGKAMISFTSSAASEIWLDEQGQVDGLRKCFDHYIEHAFALRFVEHVHFGHIVKGLNLDSAARHLHDVRTEAEAMVNRVEAGSAAFPG